MRLLRAIGRHAVSLAAFSIVGLCAAYALADAGATAVASPDPGALTLSMFYPLIAAVCGAAAGILRAKSDSDGMWHKWYGHILIMVGGSVLGALADMTARAANGGPAITKAMLIAALAGAIGAWASALQTTAKDVKAAASQVLKAAAIGLILVQLACGTAGGRALGACELGQLPQVLQTVIAKVAAIAAQPGGWEQDLEAMGVNIGPGQLSCVEQAIAAALEPSPAAPDTPTRQMMRQRLTSHAAKHPRACRDFQLLARDQRALLEQVEQDEARLRVPRNQRGTTYTYVIVDMPTNSWLGSAVGPELAPTWRSSDVTPAVVSGEDLGITTLKADAVCFDNLCGMDSYCSCHKMAGSNRCWSQREDCEVDAACCTASTAECKRQGKDQCSERTHAARTKRDANKDGGR